MPGTPASIEEWVRRVNDRWIVHEGLNEASRAYLDFLAENDPARYRKACTVAWNLVQGRESGVDPKPFFYGGLFSVATREEIGRFLSHYLITALLSPVFEDAQVEELGREHRLGEETLEKVRLWRARIREAIEKLP